MKCPEVVEWMHRYLDYDLSEEETVQLYEHLKQCPECTETFRMLKSLSRDLEDLPKVTPKFSIVDAIMPQLDAIDQARQEKSASREEAPAEMVPVPARPARTTKFRNSVAGRTAMGAAAAVIILGVAIFNYTPKHLSTAEEPAFKSEHKENVAATSDATSGAGGGQEVEPQREEPNNSGEISKRDAVDGAPQENQDDQDSTAQNQAPDGAAKEPVAKFSEQENKAEDQTGNADTKSQKKAGSGETADSGSPAAATSPSTEQTAPADSGSSQDKSLADSSSTPESPVDRKTSDSNPDESEDKTLMGISVFKEPSTQIDSPDGKYAASIEENKLVIYSLSDKGSAEKTVVKTLDLPGTWVSGVWSADSTVFTYQTTDDQGATTSKTYQVNGSDPSNP